MGRKLKRVPLDFNWPMDQVWKGFINPFHSQKCKSCDGSGLNTATKRLSDDWYSFDKEKWIYTNHNRRYNDLAWQYHLTEIEIEALVRGGRLRDAMGQSCFFDEEKNVWIGWINNEKQEIQPPVLPNPEDINQWAIDTMGHDAINQWICVKARAKHLGIYGHCEYCNGEGEIWQSDEIKKMHDDWLDFEPPTGDGFQLWSTTTEGHPMTPVFKTLEDLCEYCEKENVSVFGYNKATKAEWMDMLFEGHVFHREGNMIFI